MRSDETRRPEAPRADLDSIVARATRNAKAKNARLRLLKERHEIWLETRRSEMFDDDPMLDDDMPREL